MDFLTTLHISTTGLTAQRTTMNVIAANLANLNTTRTPEGVPYRRRIALMTAEPLEDFQAVLDGFNEGLSKVEVSEIVEEATPFRQVYDPGHPDANESGYVSFPNVDIVTEMTDMMIARRSYEANVTSIAATKRMALKALEIGK